MVSDIDKRNAVFLVYIAGYGHSGSTLLDMMLGSHTHIESMGEIKHFIQNPSIAAGNSKCACGQYARDCRYWNELTIDEGGSREGSPVVAYHFFKRVLAYTGKSIICDSSKQTGWLKGYIRRPDLFNVRIIHLVRDPRAVAYSLQRKWQKIVSKHGGRLPAMRAMIKYGKPPFSYNYYYILSAWMLTNIATSIVLRYHRAGRRVRYEDLARHTRVTLSDIMYQVGVEVESTQYNFSDMEHHNLSGNYMRCKKGQVIREDTDYLHANAVGPFKWWVATFMTLPFLLLYGYPLSRRF